MKKNQLALIFLTLITMLAVWYFKSPGEAEGEEPTLIVTTTPTRNEKLTSMRKAVQEQRNVAISQLNDIIADENATLVSKTTATLEKAELSSLSEQEVVLETKVINLGYSDAFVHSTANGVEVIVVSNESSALAAVDIISVISETFTDASSIVVNFMSEDELSKA